MDVKTDVSKTNQAPAQGAGARLSIAAKSSDRATPPDPETIQRVLKSVTPRSPKLIPPHETYQYESRLADIGKTEIRLMELLPSPRDDAPLVCNFIAADLDNQPEYETMSYCWGQPIVFDADITVNGGRKLPITRILHSALARIRPRTGDKPRILWADVVCVNQQDVEERTVQVQLMHRIYSQCKGVLIWLGDGDRTSDLGMDVVRSMCTGLAKKQSAGDQRLLYDLNAKDRARYGGLFADRSPEVTAMTSLLDRPWFSRAWVVQELSLPPRATLLCGIKAVSWEEFSLAVTSCSPSLKKFSTNENPGENHVRLSMCPSREEARKGDASSPRLVSLVARARNSKATGPRDKLFAFVGLAREQGQPGILGQPNYRLKVEDVYKRFVLETIDATQSLDVLSLVHGRDRNTLPSNSLKLSSWIPDLSVDGIPYPLTRLDKMAVDDHSTLRTKSDYLEYAASKGTRAEYQLLDDGNTFCVSGYVIATVKELGLPFPGRSEWHDKKKKLQAQRNAFASWETLVGARSRRVKYDSESAYDVYWKVMRGGELRRHYVVAQSHFQTGYEEPLRPYRLLSAGRVINSPSVFAALHRVSCGILELHNALRLLLGKARVEYKRGVGTNPCEYRRMGKTASGLVGFFPGGARQGDSVAVLQGGRVAFILRRCPGREMWELVGEAYVHGVMEGEAWDSTKCGKILIV